MGHDWQFNTNDSPLPHPTHHLNHALIGFKNPLTFIEANSQPSGFRGLKRLEYRPKAIWWNTGAIIGNLHGHRSFQHLRINRDSTQLARSLMSIEQEIEEDLL